MQLTKHLFSCLSLFFLLVVATGCEREDFDIAANTDFPPSILSSYPSANGRVVAGDFTVRVVFADGTVSPLESATVVLMDDAMTALAEQTTELSGTRDSLVIEGSAFGAADLPVGVYNMTVSVTDTKGQTTEQAFSFEISNLPFPANYDGIYLAGAFNGWTPSSNQLTLVGPNMWEAQNVDLQGEAWKLVDGPEFGGEDWGDPECDGFMNSNQSPGGNGDTDCGFSGLVNIRFNDQTLSYSVTPAVSYASNSMSLYLLGTFNNFQGSNYQFDLVDDNSWVLDEVELMPGAQFRMAEMPDFQGINYGDNENDGIAERYGSNIVLPDTAMEGFYSITFNDRSLAYSLTFLRGFAPDITTIGLIGSAVPGGWDAPNGDFSLDYNEDAGMWMTVVALVDGELKFRANDAWDLSWGSSDFPSGTATSDNGPNIPATAGTYLVTFNPEDGAFSFTPAEIGVIGNATPGGWDNDTNLSADPNELGAFTLSTTLTEGELKFRVNDAWTYNWGGDAFPSGTAVYNGSNIVATPGTYTVTFNVNTKTYSFQ
ncbi:SusF/SusE family outer membrane protein [Lewinella sp. IMCC34183]|uniref:SusF/SusE family outer membrane protein n=1 Tax=Lewinella sp. IMCC34183 TaxID=2248762 RepID=UPI000E27852E|nr:SusF/SusE family outer membrane protein [Lewinella sp. IMCC34183]